MTEAHWDEPDVLIVGAGPSGAAVALRLAEAGFRVVCLEQGAWVPPADMRHGALDWELSRLTSFNADPNLRADRVDYPVNNTASTYAPLMFNAVGGSTIHWSAHYPRYHPSDFRVRSLDGVGDDWPLTYDELEPYYDLSDRISGVAGMTGDPSQPPRSPRSTCRSRSVSWAKRSRAGSTGSAGTGGSPTAPSSPKTTTVGRRAICAARATSVARPAPGTAPT